MTPAYGHVADAFIGEFAARFPDPALAGKNAGAIFLVELFEASGDVEMAVPIRLPVSMLEKLGCDFSGLE